MDDLEKQFFAGSDDLEAQFFAEQPKEEPKRGANWAGAVRNIAQATPWIGTYADEAEGLARSLLQGGDYEKWRRNAEESALGNIANTSYGRGLEIGTNLLENSLLAGLTGGATLMPQISAAQGAIEGFGRGSDIGSRTVNAGAGGAIGFVVPSIANRILPTKTVQQQVTKQLTKSSNPAKQIIAKALEENITPEEVIARDVERGMRPDLWARLRRAYVGKNALRKPVLEQASETVSKPYAEYIKENIEEVSPKYASKIAEKIEKMKLDELGEDVIGEFDPRQYVMDAVNSVMRDAKEEEQIAVAGAIEKAIAKRGVAKKLTNVAVERPISSNSGAIYSFLRRAQAPLSDLYDRGLLRTLTVGTGAKQPQNMAQRLLDLYTPDVARGGLDALIENYERESIK